MINKNNFYLNTLQFKKNLSKTKKIFNILKKAFQILNFHFFKVLKKNIFLILI